MGSIGEPANGEGNGSTTIDVDVLVVGAGFSGITAIDRFRKLGKTVKCFESGEYFGGVWHWCVFPSNYF
jgi:cation diffusion facilitator CzcD-associated flavoprotein CzcO